MASNGLDVSRLIVVQPTRPSGLPYAWLSIGVLRWWSPERRLTIIAKAAFHYEPQRGREGQAVVPRLAGAAPALSLDQEGLESPDELFYASDFVPRKAGTDVLLVGHAFSVGRPEGEPPPARIACGVQVDQWRRQFEVGWQEPSEAIALSGRTVKTVGADADRGTSGLRLGNDPAQTHQEDFDFSAYGAAPGWLRAPELRPDAEIELVGLSRHGQERQLRLPGLHPQVAVELPWLEEATEVGMTLDTVWLDTDHEVLHLTWRGSLPVRGEGQSISRLLVSLERASQPRSWSELRTRVPGGRVQYALRVVDLLPGAEPVPTDDERLRAARVGMILEGPGEPELSLEEYAQWSAELGEQTDAEGRKAVLEAHGWDEERWGKEERAWLDRMSRDALDGDVNLSKRYSDLFTEAQDQLAKAGEEQRGIEDLALILFEMETATDPLEPLTRRKMSLAELMRLQRRLVREQQEDSDAAVELQDELDRLRKEREQQTAQGEDEAGPAS